MDIKPDGRDKKSKKWLVVKIHLLMIKMDMIIEEAAEIIYYKRKV